MSAEAENSASRAFRFPRECYRSRKFSGDAAVKWTRRFFRARTPSRMADIIDLTFLADVRRFFHKLLDQRGLSYFLQKDGARLFHIEPTKVELVLRTALRARDPELPRPHDKAIEHCRKEVRRELIRRVANAMLQTGL